MFQFVMLQKIINENKKMNEINRDSIPKLDVDLKLEKEFESLDKDKL